MKQFFSALILLLILTQTAWAQTFAIKGKLVDKISGEGLAGASVQVKNAEVNTGSLTEVNGTFKIENLKPGTYRLQAARAQRRSLLRRLERLDALSALVEWVENGKAPASLTASVNAANKELPSSWSPERTRPLCPWPAYARYLSGDPEMAASFECANP